jgi:hypothetical protein
MIYSGTQNFSIQDYVYVLFGSPSETIKILRCPSCMYGRSCTVGIGLRVEGWYMRRGRPYTPNIIVMTTSTCATAIMHGSRTEELWDHLKH